MSPSFIKVYIHATWSTKYRRSILSKSFENDLSRFMVKEFTAMGIRVLAINNVEDHVHVLFQLHREKSLASVIKQVKGASSRHINKMEWTKRRFRWQVGYSAFSVQYNDLNGVIRYIEQQKEHHATRSFKEIYEELMKEWEI